jgi:hypothetical protein
MDIIAISYQDARTLLPKIGERFGWLRVADLKYSFVAPNCWALMEFDADDVEFKTAGTKLFTNQLADEIIEFYSLCKRNVDTLIVNCFMGQSRSVAIVAALNVIEGNEIGYYFRHKMPNYLIFRKMLNAAQRANLIEAETLQQSLYALTLGPIRV